MGWGLGQAEAPARREGGGNHARHAFPRVFVAALAKMASGGANAGGSRVYPPSVRSCWRNQARASSRWAGEKSGQNWSTT